MPAPIRVDEADLSAALYSCCQHVCEAEGSGLRTEDVDSLYGLVRFLVNGFAPPKMLIELESQIAKTLGYLEDNKPGCWEENYEILNDLLVVVSAAVHIA